jgi:pentatricopeptide repeat protein
MIEEDLKILLQYYGISPWEIEVIYGYLNSRFTVIQEEIDVNDENFVSFLDLEIPLAFNEEFFKWFEYRRWEKMKEVFKEMKRRRGTGNALKIKINFVGNPKIVFVLDTEERQWYDNAIEKIDFVLELLPYHLDPEKIPDNILEVTYRFDQKSTRWRLSTASSENKKYVFRGDVWNAVT